MLNDCRLVSSKLIRMYWRQQFVTIVQFTLVYVNETVKDAELVSLVALFSVSLVHLISFGNAIGCFPPHPCNYLLSKSLVW